KTFSFRDSDVTIKDVPRLLDSIYKELDSDHSLFSEWDAAMYANHYRAAYLLDPDRAAELRRRWELQMTMQTWILRLMACRSALDKALEAASRGEVQPEQFAQLKQLLQDAADRLAGVHAKAGTISCPAMSNVPEGKSLADLIRPGDWQTPNFT